MCGHYYIVIIVVSFRLVAIFISFTFMPITLKLFISENKDLSYMCTNAGSVGLLQ